MSYIYTANTLNIMSLFRRPSGPLELTRTQTLLNASCLFYLLKCFFFRPQSVQMTESSKLHVKAYLWW
uniref:Uncharacterized protein n=1 Tax=Anguilla anguilla TaxID=7936 RepID=A0A0E9UC58_ANGAN